MRESLIANLTSKDDKFACAIADRIISESQDTDEWYGYFDTFASLLNHPTEHWRQECVMHDFLPTI